MHSFTKNVDCSLVYDLRVHRLKYVTFKNLFKLFTSEIGYKTNHGLALLEAQINKPDYVSH